MRAIASNGGSIKGNFCTQFFCFIFFSLFFFSDEDPKKEINPRIFEFLASMKNTCKLKRPEVCYTSSICHFK